MEQSNNIKVKSEADRKKKESKIATIILKFTKATFKDKQ